MKRNRLKHLLASIIIPIVFFIILELIVRLIGFAYNTEDKRQLPLWVLSNIREKAFMPDPRLFWRPVPNSKKLITNSLGLHEDKEISYIKAKDEFRILCLGDSITWGFGVYYQDAYPYLVEKILNNTMTPYVYETINAGVPGYSSLQGLRYLEELKFLKPDIVTIMFGRNDIRHLNEEGGYLPDNKVKILPKWLIQIRKFLKKSQLYNLLTFLLTNRQINPFKNDITKVNSKNAHRVEPEDYRKNILKMIEICRRHKFTPILITTVVFPEKIGTYNYILKQIAREKNVPIIDLVPVFKKYGIRPLLNDECHPNKRGHKLIAKEIAKFILKRIDPDLAVEKNIYL